MALHKLATSAATRSLLVAALERSPWVAAPLAALGAAVALTAAGVLALLGFAVSFAYSYDISRGANYYTGVWICGFAALLVVQATTIICAPAAVSGGHPAARLAAWLCYSAWMACASLIMLIGMAAPGMASQSGWAFLWWPPIAVLAAGALFAGFVFNGLAHGRV